MRGISGRRSQLWRGIAALAVVAGAASCGSSPGNGTTAADDAKGHSYGSTTAVTSPSTTARVAAATAATTRAAPTTAAPTPTPATAPPSTTRTTRPPNVANRSVRRDASGLELTLVVADKVEFEKAEDMTLEVSFVNTNDGELYRNGAQSVFFEITGGGRTWSTTTCQPDYGGQRPPPTALAIEPGEPNRFVGTYPASPGFRTRDQCRLPPGDYEVAGLVDWCPPETITRPSGGGQACDGATDVPVRSAPVEVRIT